MRKIPYKTWLVAGVLLLLPCVAQAAGLGQLRILSALGQPLVAEIELISVQRDELATLTARLASPDAYRQANLQYSPGLIGARFSIERRGNGQPYIRITSTRVLNEPFVELLVELSWAQGRLMREYTALIDPPDLITGQPPAAAITPPAAPQATPIAPAVTAPPQTRPAAKAAATAAPARTGGQEYGPVKRGETLAQIAAGVKPQGVTLEQTLVSLYRSNPDAFAGNMNRLKTGRILRVPEQEEMANTAQTEAVKEVRVQTSNWNAYREKLAETAGDTPARESKSAASGKITTTVDDKAAGKETPKEVLKLSKSEPLASGKAATGKPMSTRDRIRVLEEEALAREKAVMDANDRIAQLEKTIKEMQRLVELKGVPPVVPKPSEAPAAPAAKSDQVAKVEPPKAEPPKVDAAKTEPAKDAGKAPAEAPKAEEKAAPPAPPPVATPAGEAPKGDAAKAEPPKGEQVATEPPPPPKPKPKIVAPPPPTPGLIDEIFGDYLIPGVVVLLALLGGLGYWIMRRRATAVGDDEIVDKQAPRLGGKTAADHAAQMATTTIMPAPLVTDDVDPLAEADLYLNFGRDAQAEEVLKEALEKNPKHVEAQLKLLQIYASRKDKTTFEKVARNLNEQIGSASDNWVKAAAMGYAFDPENGLYEAGKSVPAAAIPGAVSAAAGPELDFDLELSPTTGAATTTDFELDAGKTMIMQPDEMPDIGAGPGPTTTQDITGDTAAVTSAEETAAAAPEFTLDVTAAAPEPMEPDITVDAPSDADAKNNVTDVTGEFTSPMASAIDFNFDAEPEPAAATQAPQAAKGFTHDGTVILSPENRDLASGLTLDFETSPASGVETTANLGTTTKVEPDIKLDLDTSAPIAPDFKLDDINLNFDDTPATEGAKAEGGSAKAEAGGAKDDHWYDVQTKFDLAKAYQEMGDKDGAREILQEVIKEGDAGQQIEAKQLLDSLS